MLLHTSINKSCLTSPMYNNSVDGGSGHCVYSDWYQPFNRKEYTNGSISKIKSGRGWSFSGNGTSWIPNFRVKTKIGQVKGYWEGYEYG